MKTELQRLFFEVVEKDFGFMLAEGKFKGPFPELDARTGIFTVVFAGTNLAVELILDERDEDISCKVSRMVNERPAIDYAVDSHGRLVRASVSQLLRARGIRDVLFTWVTGLTVKDQVPITLGDYARMLQAHAPMVLDDDPDFLSVKKA
jgi:hypothetical protein